MTWYDEDTLHKAFFNTLVNKQFSKSWQLLLQLIPKQQTPVEQPEKSVCSIFFLAVCLSA